jgi:hypothetical protein
MIEPISAAETLAEAAALPPPPAPAIDRTGLTFRIENPSGDNRTPTRVLIYNAAGRESVLDGVVGFSVDSLRGVLTLELRPEHLHVEHVANAPA